jgi:hypothetical protein
MTTIYRIPGFDMCALRDTLRAVQVKFATLDATFDAATEEMVVDLASAAYAFSRGVDALARAISIGDLPPWDRQTDSDDPRSDLEP